MTRYEKTLVIVMSILLGMVTLDQTYKAGERKSESLFHQMLMQSVMHNLKYIGVARKHGYDNGYSDGWRDAHCGIGNNCEAGDE